MFSNRPAASADAVRCYVRSTVAIDRMIAFYLPSLLPGYGWIFPMGGGEYNVGCAVFRPNGERARLSLRSAFEEFSTRFPPARELFGAAEAVTPLRGARSRCGLEGMRRLVEGHVLAAGETIGSTLLFTGEGVGTAMHTGELAAAALHEALSAGSAGPLERYPRRVREELRPRHMAFRAAQKVASVGWLNDFVSRLGRKGGCLHPLIASATSDQPHSRSVRFMRRLIHWLAK